MPRRPDGSARRRFQGVTGPIPRSVRRLRGDISKPDVLASEAAIASSTKTVRGLATAVSRLARFTVIPKTSPSRDTTCPLAMPTRTSGRRSSSAMASTRSSAMAAAGAAPLATNRTSSPTVLMTRPPCAVTTSDASASKRCTTRASSRSESRRTRRVNETRSAKPTQRTTPALSIVGSESETMREMAADRWRRQA